MVNVFSYLPPRGETDRIAGPHRSGPAGGASWIRKVAVGAGAIDHLRASPGVTRPVLTRPARAKELMHRLGHASPRAALRYQHATAKRDEAIADGIDRILDAAQRDGGPNSNVLRFRDSARDA